MSGASVQSALTIEVHDVTPALAPEIAVICDALAEAGFNKPTLLVVPAYVDRNGKSWDLRNYDHMAAWLRAKQAAGCDIVQHGLTHRAHAPPPAGLRNSFMHYVFSRGCAEFAHLDGVEARARLLVGRRILAACGLHSEGFIAPAWQQSSAAIVALRQLGYAFTAFFGHVQGLTPTAPLAAVARERADDGLPAPLRTPALTFDAQSALVDYGKRAVMRVREFLARDRPLLRVALHPADVHGSRPLEHIVRRIRVLARSRRVVTYRDWFAAPQALRAAA